jgi:acyl-coenzyme A thioesterase PaaI-like protein
VTIKVESSSPFMASHADCYACGRNNRDGFGLVFRTSPSGGVEADFYCDLKYQGYPGFLQGGVVATLLDSAMTHCLFHRGIAAMTGRMHIQFRKPVHVGEQVRIRADLVQQRGPLYRLWAELTQGNSVCAKTSATFMQISERLKKGSSPGQVPVPGCPNRRNRPFLLPCCGREVSCEKRPCDE